MNSDPKVIFSGRIKNGIRFYNKPLAHDALMKKIEEEGGEFDETLCLHFVDTTIDQHGYYRVSIRWLINKTESFAGWDQEELHQNLYRKHMGEVIRKEIHYPSGKVEVANFLYLPKFSRLGKRRMKEYIEKLTISLAQEGILLPEPNTYTHGRYQTRIKKVKNEQDKEQ